MSWNASGWAMGLSEGMSPDEKLLLLVLSDCHEDEHNTAAADLPWLARESCMSEDDAHSCVRSLVGRGYIEILKVDRNGKPESYSFLRLEDE